MFGAPATAHFWQLIPALRRRGRSQECTFARKLPRGTAPRVARELRRGAGRRPIFFYVLKTLSELRNWMEFDNLLSKMHFRPGRAGELRRGVPDDALVGELRRRVDFPGGVRKVEPFRQKRPLSRKNYASRRLCNFCQF